jgi:vacuolar-type H+-ATPase subunit I/STV1
MKEKMMKAKMTEFVVCKYIFSEEELKVIAQKMAYNQREKKDTEEEKKKVMSTYKNKLDIVEAHLNSNAQKIDTGYEMRGIECEIYYDFANDLKIWIRPDTGETVKDCKIPEEEKQVTFEDMPVDGEIVDAVIIDSKTGKVERQIEHKKNSEDENPEEDGTEKE